MYNGHKEIKDYKPEEDIRMTTSRKTTYEERIEIVKHCIKHNKSYKQTTKHYGVAYSQVYQWVKKYIEQGKEGLLDCRGRKKLESELNETDKLKRKLEQLQATNERLEMENEVLKKQEEIERRLSLARSGKNQNI